MDIYQICIIVESDKEEDERLVGKNESIEPENEDISPKNSLNIENEIVVKQ